MDYSSILIFGVVIVSLLGVLNLIAAWWLTVFVMEKHSEHSWRIVRAITAAASKFDRSATNVANQGPAHSEAGGTSQCTFAGSSLTGTDGSKSFHETSRKDSLHDSFSEQELADMDWMEIPLHPGSTLKVRKNLFGFDRT